MLTVFLHPSPPFTRINQSGLPFKDSFIKRVLLFTFSIWKGTTMHSVFYVVYVPDEYFLKILLIFSTSGWLIPMKKSHDFKVVPTVILYLTHLCGSVCFNHLPVSYFSHLAWMHIVLSRDNGHQLPNTRPFDPYSIMRVSLYCCSPVSGSQSIMRVSQYRSPPISFLFSLA
jgi:hypothetical protein